MIVEDPTFPASSSYYEMDALVLQGDAHRRRVLIVARRRERSGA
jgi:hypothetical protein